MEPLALQLIQSDDGGLRLRFEASSIGLHAEPPAASGDPGLISYGRIYAVVQLIGSACCNTHSLAAAMLIPRESLAHLIAPDAKPPPLVPTGAVLDSMHDPSLLDLDASSAFVAKFLELYSLSGASGLPARLPRPIRLLAWRLDSPPRIVLFNDTAPPAPSVMDPLTLKPHTLQKILVNEHSKRHAPSSIHVVSSVGGAADNIRDSITHYAQHRLESFKETVVSVARSGLRDAFVQAHTLEEALACFIHPPQGQHTEIPINESTCWNKSHIDPRCHVPPPSSYYSTLFFSLSFLLSLTPFFFWSSSNQYSQ